MKYTPTLGYVLHSRRYRDTSLIVQCFTEVHGRLSVVAKGASRPKSPFRHTLQPGKLLTFAASGKTDLLTLTMAEEANTGVSAQLKLPTEHFFALAYLNELLLKSTANFDPHPELFADYQLTVAALTSQTSADSNRPEASIAWILRRFEYQLLTKLGLMSDVSMVVDTEASPSADPDQWYAYHPEMGLCSAGRYHPSVAPPISGEAIRCLLADQPLLDSAVESHQALKRLMRRLIDLAIPGELKSREVMRAAWQARQSDLPSP